MLPSPVSKKISQVCNDDEVVSDYLKTKEVPGGVLFQCSHLSLYSTSYKVGQFIILPGSTNISPLFGRIKKLLCCKKFGYLLYQCTNTEYCKKTDLFFPIENDHQEVIPAQQLLE